jgi:hypothetical protein
VMFDTFPETRWLASLIGVSSPGSSAASGPDAGLPASAPNSGPVP